MNHDAADLAMFWVGALFVFTPMVFFGIVIGVWWYQRRRAGGAAEAGGAGGVEDGSSRSVTAAAPAAAPASPALSASPDER